MVVISKPLFYEKIGDQVKCDSIHFWAKNCSQGNAIIAFRAFIGSLKFFLPIYIFKAIINHRKLKDDKFLIKLLTEEIRSGVFGLIMAHLIILSNCVLCKINGRINYYNLALISGAISGLSIMVETKENRTLDCLIFSNLLIEAMFRNMDYFNILKLTNTKETMIFMVVSGLLMHVLQNRKKNFNFANFWFFTPPRFRKENFDETTKGKMKQDCNHKQTCECYSLQGTKKYFMLGYAFSVVRKLIPTMLIILKNPEKILNIAINKDNMKFGLFIGTYVGLYRYITCFLLKSKSIDQKYSGAIAGCFSGATYMISPNLQVLTVGITTLLQIFYHRILKSIEIKSPFVPEVIVYMLSHGMLFHNAIMCKDTCPSYYMNMLDTCSNNMFGDIYRTIVVKYFL